MTHFTPFRIVPRRSIRIRQSKSKTRRALHARTIDLDSRFSLRLRLLEFVPIDNWLLLLAVEGSHEAFWLEVIDDFVDYVCFLQTVMI